MERLAGQFEAVWRRRPTEAELAGLIEDFVREEVYYREALALGLDRDDTVIRRRLRQKMEFLSDAGAGALVADEAELRAYFARPRRSVHAGGAGHVPAGISRRRQTPRRSWRRWRRGPIQGRWGTAHCCRR